MKLKTQYDEKCVDWDTKAAETCSDPPPPADCTTDLQWEHQSIDAYVLSKWASNFMII